MTTVIVVSGQSLLDIAVQAAGSVEAAFEIAAANGLSVTDELTAGMSLAIPTVHNQAVADRFRVAGLIPKSGLRPEDIEAAPFGGIGYMGIEIDFIIS